MLIAVFVLLSALALRPRAGASARESVVVALAAAAVLAAALTVVESLAGVLVPAVAFASWGVACLGALALVPRGAFRFERTATATPSQREEIAWERRIERLEVVVVVVMLLLTLAVAVRSVPRVYDALAYQAPRVFFWLQNHTAAFFPTAEPRQNYISPFTSYVTAQLMLLQVGDRAQLVVQWTAFLGTVLAATLIADELGARRSTRFLVAALVATLPNLALQAQTALSDDVTTFCFALSVWAMLRARRVSSRREAAGSGALVGAGLGLSVLSKASSVFALLPFGLWWLLRREVQGRPRNLRLRTTEVAIAAVVMLALNGYHFAQAQLAYGSPLSTAGHASYLNESFTPPAMAGSLLEHLGSQIVLPVTTSPVRVGLGDPWNRAVERTVRALEGWMGVDPDADNLPPGTRYSLALDGPTPPPVANSPQSGNSPLHFVLGTVAVVALLVRGRADRSRRGVAVAALVGFVLLACTFRWQPWIVRFHLPYLMLGSVLAALAFEEVSRRSLARSLRVVTVGLLFAVAAAFTVVHQEQDLRTVWTTPRRDLSLQAPLVRPLAERVAHFESIGILAPPNVIEYPFLRELHAAAPRARISPVFAELPWRGGVRHSDDTPEAILLITQYREPRASDLERLRRARYREVLSNPMGRAFVRRRNRP